MQIAIPLYDRFTALDASAPTRCSRASPRAGDIRGNEPGPYTTDNGMLTCWRRLPRRLPHPEVLMVPGGFGTRAAVSDERMVGWIRQVHETSQWTTSTCTGSLLLGAAGLLEGLDATTHWLELEALRSSAPTPPSAGSSSRGRSSRRPGCRRVSTWRWSSPRGSPETTSPRRCS